MNDYKFTCYEWTALVLFFFGAWIVAGCGNKMPDGPATCATLCERLEDCNTLPDVLCISGVCHNVHCLTECNKFKDKVRQEILDDFQVCIWSMSCGALKGQGYDDCLNKAYFNRSDFPPARASTCEQLKSRAQALCTSNECKSVINTIFRYCQTWGTIASDSSFPDALNCQSRTACLSMMRCMEPFYCSYSFDGTKFCMAGPTPSRCQDP